MSTDQSGVSNHRKWAEFRLSIIGSLLAAPPGQGELIKAIRELAIKNWQHPITRSPLKLSEATIERWYYWARRSDNPIDELIKKSRKDKGVRKLTGTALEGQIKALYKEHSGWNKRLHFDNLAVIVKKEPSLGPMPSYPTLCRWMREYGLVRITKRRNSEHSGASHYRSIFHSKETRSFEAPYPGSLWHLDFHHANRRVLTADGRWITPILLAIIDDKSRLACHVQWYEEETTDCLVHGYRQALQKRGLPVAQLSDNGSAMVSAEFLGGLKRLSIISHTTLPYCPEQNGKQERFFGTVESRLMSMMENKKNLTLKELNDITAVWVEKDYNQKEHEEIKRTPLESFLKEKNLHRITPDGEGLALAFTRGASRKPRHFDSTVSIEGVRFDLPWVYRHLSKVIVRYAGWDLSSAWLMDPDGEKVICRIHPLDKIANGSGLRRSTNSEIEVFEEPKDDIAPMIKNMMADYAMTGLPYSYISKENKKEK